MVKYAEWHPRLCIDIMRPKAIVAIHANQLEGFGERRPIGEYRSDGLLGAQVCRGWDPLRLDCLQRLGDAASLSAGAVGILHLDARNADVLLCSWGGNLDEKSREVVQDLKDLFIFSVQRVMPFGIILMQENWALPVFFKSPSIIRY